MLFERRGSGRGPGGRLRHERGGAPDGGPDEAREAAPEPGAGGPGLAVVVLGGAVALLAALALATGLLATVGWVLNQVVFDGAPGSVERAALVLWVLVAAAALAVSIKVTGGRR